MKRYYNKTTNKYYTEGEFLAIHLKDKLFIGIPNEKDLAEWGYEEYKVPTYTPTEEDNKRNRMNEIQSELSSMDYLTSKYIDGEDMSQYGDWREKRKVLREEYRELESQLVGD